MTPRDCLNFETLRELTCTEVCINYTHIHNYKYRHTHTCCCCCCWLVSCVSPFSCTTGENGAADKGASGSAHTSSGAHLTPLLPSPSHLEPSPTTALYSSTWTRVTSASLSKRLVTELEEGESARVCACTVESFAVHLSPAPDGRIYAKWDGPVCGKDIARARLWLYHTGPSI